MKNDKKLGMDELDGVTGGTYLESASDAKNFQKIGVKVYENDILGVPVVQFDKLRDAFTKFGVTVKDHGGLVNENEYFINGKQVSRDDAWKHINKVAGK